MGKLPYFPLTKKQRKFLRLVYDTVEAKGRFPSFQEAAAYMGWGLRANLLWSVKIIRLHRRGWLTKQTTGSRIHGWWPAGVDRNMTFKYPATLFIKNRSSATVPGASDRMLPGEPESLERLIHLSNVAVAAGYAVEDALTINWATDTIIQLIKLARTLKAGATHCGRNSDPARVSLEKQHFVELLGALPEIVLISDNRNFPNIDRLRIH
jgi:hypothetical protein